MLAKTTFAPPGTFLERIFRMMQAKLRQGWPYWFSLGRGNRGCSNPSLSPVGAVNVLGACRLLRGEYFTHMPCLIRGGAVRRAIKAYSIWARERPLCCLRGMIEKSDLPCQSLVERRNVHRITTWCASSPANHRDGQENPGGVEVWTVDLGINGPDVA